MKRNHYLILGGIALIGGYLWYKKREKAEIAKKALNTSVAPPMKEGEVSNIQGTTCKCDNGFEGYCQSGDCSKCCGSYNDKKRPTETRTYTFMRKGQQPTRDYRSASYASNY